MKRVMLAMVSAVFLVMSMDARAEEPSKLRIATEGAYPPYNLVLPSGELAGYDVDVARDLCGRLKVECEIVAQDWDGIIPGLNAGKYDAIIAAMVTTPERAEVVDFTAPYGKMSLSFIAPKSSELASLKPEQTDYSLSDDPEKAQKAIDALKPLLKGKLIGVQSSTTQAQFVEHYLKGTAEPREYKTAEAMILDLNAGRIDAALDAIGFFSGILASKDGQDLTFIGPRFSGGLFGGDSVIAVRKGDALKDKINEALAAAKADGSLKALSEKWFHTDISPAP